MFARCAVERKRIAGTAKAPRKAEGLGSFTTLVLVGSAAFGYCGYGAEEDFDVEQERPLVDVAEVEFDAVVEVRAGSAGDLPEAGDAGLYGEAAHEPGFVETLYVA